MGGRYHNTASDDSATVGGGDNNEATAPQTTVSGGLSNTASGLVATVGGGYDNVASGNYATVPGGLENTAGEYFSFAAGRQAKANHEGAFVWADAIGQDFASTADNQFVARATGGVKIWVDTAASGLRLFPATAGTMPRA